MKLRVGLFFVLLFVCFGASLACRDHGADAGVGGQSGDEGRRLSGPVLGTGGVGPVLTSRR